MSVAAVPGTTMSYKQHSIIILPLNVIVTEEPGVLVVVALLLLVPHPGPKEKMGIFKCLLITTIAHLKDVTV